MPIFIGMVVELSEMIFFQNLQHVGSSMVCAVIGGIEEGWNSYGSFMWEGKVGSRYL